MVSTVGIHRDHISDTRETVVDEELNLAHICDTLLISVSFRIFKSCEVVVLVLDEIAFNVRFLLNDTTCLSNQVLHYKIAKNLQVRFCVGLFLTLDVFFW